MSVLNDPVAPIFKWAERLAAENGFVKGKTVKSPEGFFYEVTEIGFGGDEISVTLRLVGQPNAKPRTVIIEENRPKIAWGRQTF